jgi:MFS transporter, SHS family, lactate transporter
MVPIAKGFDVPLTAVTAVFTITLWMRLVGATAAGWMADRMGRKAPLMISILWYPLCNFIAGFSPTLRSCSFSARCLVLGWARNGRPERPSRWNPGRRAPADS